MVDRKALICLFVLHACGGRVLKGDAPPSIGVGVGGADRASGGHSGNMTYPSGSRQPNGGFGASTCSPPWACRSEVWRCSSWYFASGDGCDCNCGAWDPDCDDPAEGIFGCGLGETTCEAPGVCKVGSWSCNQGFYGTRDGCDCNCGAWDPDCDDPTQRVLGCGIGWTCTPPGICGVGGWSCPAGRFGSGDGCDCNCGAWDPDCDDPNQEVLNCAGEEACARPGVCVTDTTSGGATSGGATSGGATSGSNGGRGAAWSAGGAGFASDCRTDRDCGPGLQCRYYWSYTTHCAMHLECQRHGDECGSDWDCDVRQSCMADASGTHRCEQRRCWHD